MDYGQMLGDVSAPTAQQPSGGMPQQMQDPTVYESAVTAQALQRLADLYAQVGDEKRSIKVQKMAVELRQVRAEREKEMTERFKSAQELILPQIM